jgi:hypothetical protein
MAASTPERVSATPPLDPPAAPPRRTKKPSAKVQEAQQSLRTRAQISAQFEQQTTAPQTGLQATQHILPPFPTARVSTSPEREGGGINRDELYRLIESLKETIAQQSNIITNQNSIIESIRNDLVDIKSEQRSLKKQNAELQKAIRSLRAQPNTPSAPTQSWASVAASGGTAGSEITLPQTTSARNPKEPNQQLVIDVSRAGSEATERVATTEAAKQTIAQGIKDVERLTGAILKDFRIWRTSDSASIIRFSVEKDKEAAFRQTTAQWLEPHIPGARLVGPKWYAVKADWVEVPLAMDIDSGKVSKSAMERFGVENGVEVCTMRWLGQPRPRGQHASVIVKVATKEDAERLLTSDNASFGGGAIIISPFEERRTPVACYKCRRFGHRARDCTRPDTCEMCGREGHLRCETVNLHCVNCQGPHQASHRECPAYRKEMDRILARQRYE